MSGRTTSVVLVTLVIVVGLGAALFALLGRGGVDPAGAAASQVESTSTVPEAGSTTTTTAGTTTTGATTTVEIRDTDYTLTEDSYASDATSITITKVTTGSGDDTVTYYVADVQLTSGTDLRAGLADGFERGNIDYTSSIAAQNEAIFAVNGDYCTARDTGVIIRNGVVYLDNPARVGLAIYEDGTMRVYDETVVSAEEMLADGVWNTYSFGPALLVDGVIPDGLDETEVEDIGEKHTILGSQPRTGIGIVEADHFVFVVVDGRDSGYSKGVTLSEFAEIFQGLGCSVAYNLDGGGSSTMYFNGRLVNDPLGEGKERGISDILLVR